MAPELTVPGSEAATAWYSSSSEALGGGDCLSETAVSSSTTAGSPRSSPTGEAPIPTKSSSSRFKTFSSLRYRDYRFLWVGTLFMSAGQMIQQVTLGWLVYDLTNSTVLLGVLQAVRALPFLLVTPMAGVWVDRFDRRKMMM